MGSAEPMLATTLDTIQEIFHTNMSMYRNYTPIVLANFEIFLWFSRLVHSTQRWKSFVRPGHGINRCIYFSRNISAIVQNTTEWNSWKNTSVICWTSRGVFFCYYPIAVSDRVRCMCHVVLNSFFFFFLLFATTKSKSCLLCMLRFSFLFILL